MVSLSNEHVGSNQRQRGGPGGPYGREGLADRSEDLDHPAQRSVPFVPHVGASRGGELGSDEDRPVVGDVLDHAEPPHAPSATAAGNACLLFNESGIICTGTGAGARRTGPISGRPDPVTSFASLTLFKVNFAPRSRTFARPPGPRSGSAPTAFRTY